MTGSVGATMSLRSGRRQVCKVLPFRLALQSSFICLNLETVDVLTANENKYKENFQLRPKKTTQILKKIASRANKVIHWLSIGGKCASLLDFLIPSKSPTFASVNTPFYPLSWQPSVLTPEGYCWVDGLFSILNSFYFVIQKSQSHWAFVKGFG